MKTYQHSPMFPCYASPKDIIGHGFYPIFLEHYKLAHKTEPDVFHRSLRPISPANRSKISEIYVDLRSNGFFPMGITDDGEINWGVVIDKRPDRKAWQEIEISLDEVG